MELFKSYNRDYFGPARRHESHFGYLERSARPEIGKVRALVETWFSRYPASHQNQLVSRLRSENDIDHLSSFFELALYEMLRRAGCEIEIEPDIDGSSKHPDFLVRSEGTDYYLEATLGIESDEKGRSSAVIKNILDQIDTIRSDRFFVAVECEGTIKNTPSKRWIISAVEKWLSKLDPGTVHRAHVEGNEDTFQHILILDDLVVKLTPFPKRDDNPSDRLIGFEMLEPRWLSTTDTIRGRVLEKARRYGELKKPYIIAVNLLGLAADRNDLLDALFGRRSFHVDFKNGDAVHTDTTRLLDGALHDRRGARYTRVSGVLWTHGLTSSNLATRTLELICNPFALLPLKSVDLPVPTLVSGNSQFEEIPGLTVGKILGLPPRWPEDV